MTKHGENILVDLLVQLLLDFPVWCEPYSLFLAEKLNKKGLGENVFRGAV